MTSPRVLIIGGGMSGICLGIKLKQAGIESFTILEKSDDIGGTWRDNTYPGAACDIPSFLYSFSFAPKYDWQRRYAEQPEILQYFRDCAERFGILNHVQYGQTVVGAEFDEEQNEWRVETDDQQVHTADFLVSAVGQLSHPKTPAFKGLDSFGGTQFHSARWNHDWDLEGRDVAVVGNAASAIQFLSHVAGKANKTYLFQRTPNWISPRYDYAYSKLAHWSFQMVPGLARLHRYLQLLSHEWRILLFGKASLFNRSMTYWLRSRMKRRIREEYRSRLLPSYPAGCKRILLSNDYLPLVQSDAIELVTAPIKEVTENAVVAADRAREVDTIIFATGFESTRFMSPMEIRGRGGRTLDEAWTPRPKTLLGMLTPGFPNFFSLYGPNTNLGHNSIIFMVECQAHYLVKCVRKAMSSGGLIEVREDAVEQFDAKLQTGLDKTVWSYNCSNWYKNADGAITNNWSSSIWAYWWRTRSPDFQQFLTESPRQTESIPST